MIDKPVTPATINFGNPLAQGLICCLLANEMGGPLVDLVSAQTVPLIGSGVRGVFQFGPGLNCNGNASGATKTAWDRLKNVSQQCTVLFRGQVASGGSNFSTLFGVAYANPSATPFYAYLLDRGALGTTVRINWNSGGVQNNLTGTPTAYDGTERQYVGVIRGSSGLCELFETTAAGLTQRLNSSSANAGPNYTATSSLDVGYGSGTSDSKTIFRHGYIWNRALTRTEIEQLFVEPYAFIKSPRRYRFAQPLAPGSAIFRRTLSEYGTRTGSRQEMR
jgi:hypothetical protein